MLGGWAGNGTPVGLGACLWLRLYVCLSIYSSVPMCRKLLDLLDFTPIIARKKEGSRAPLLFMQGLPNGHELKYLVLRHFLGRRRECAPF